MLSSLVFRLVGFPVRSQILARFAWSFFPYSISPFQIAISASNTGGAWDNAKKYIEVKSHRIQRTISSVQICILPYVKKALLKEVPLLKE